MVFQINIFETWLFMHTIENASGPFIFRKYLEISKYSYHSNFSPNNVLPPEAILFVLWFPRNWLHSNEKFIKSSLFFTKKNRQCPSGNKHYIVPVKLELYMHCSTCYNILCISALFPCCCCFSY